MNEIKTVSDIPVRWYMVTIRSGQKFEIDELTVEQFIKADKIIVLRDDKKRIIRYINKADVSEIFWDKPLTIKKYKGEKKELAEITESKPEYELIDGVYKLKKNIIKN